MRLGNEILAGALGGLAGGMVMTTFMVAGSRAGLVREPLPQKIERWAEDRIGIERRPGPRQEEVIGQAGHLVFSAALGALYGALRASRNLPALPTGPIYGLGLYAIDLAGVGPGLGITRGPWNEGPNKVGRRIMMHTVFGTVTALVAGYIRKRL